MNVHLVDFCEEVQTLLAKVTTPHVGGTFNLEAPRKFWEIVEIFTQSLIPEQCVPTNSNT
jgi:hypothetical protein